ncbi:EamA family transporter [Pseudogemmobacter sp. W21_MBD1_M6]|uniref:EamA family transporter n=1 Tax=Pseudogemmobacter sp. W21_MBD1_M6 TaxID=3240271 RepID=UPI003F9B2030
MDIWIPVTIAAAFAQTIRFMLQKHLKATRLSTAGATFARFVYSAPLVALLVWVYLWVSGQDIPGLSPRFWAFAMTGGLAQILATMCVVALFSHRNFAVGITFTKTVVVQTALVGFVLLGEGVSPAGIAAIALGLVGVLLLSDPPGGTGAWHKRIMNRAAGLGLLSGVFFAFSAVGYRGASLALSGGDVFLRAAFTLAIVTATQTIAMALWLAWRERGQMALVARHWRIAGLVGVTSMAGSLCWFTAFTLQTAAYVNALGQVELIFGFIASHFFFKERNSPRELWGLAVLMTSILLLILLI